MNYYPSGVRGNERELTGRPPCTNCGHDIDEHDGGGAWCAECGCTEYNDEPTEKDPDRERDERMGR